jgi:transcriptional regulator with XRE-family HTH domain
VDSAIWKVIREDLARRVSAVTSLRISQEQIAEVGGGRQNDVSRLFKSSNPSVDTVVRILWGLGVKPSEFFAQLEEHFPTPEPRWAAVANVRPPTEADHALAPQRARLQEIARAALRAYELAQVSLLSAKDDRPKSRR